MIQKKIVPGAHGDAFKVKKGDIVTIKDLEGEQVVDFLAFLAPDYKEHLSVSRTRFGLRRLYLLEGDQLLSNLHRPIAEIVQDTVKLHNLTAPACSPEFYESLGGNPKQRSCTNNFIETLKDYGIEGWRLPDPLNLFQNTPNLYHTSPEDTTELSLGEAASKPGDSITLRFLHDAIFAVSSCPFTMFGFNGGTSTPIEVTIEST